ncbi:hypothetical protein HDU76_000507 [Blyttiomyces sp. JEL0837]|nr:hypothetical protein HDU76_000507 [Blyttiomyces sp. JEL0837]
MINMLITRGANPWKKCLGGEWAISRLLREKSGVGAIATLLTSMQTGPGRADEVAIIGLGLHAAYYNLKFHIVAKLLPLMAVKDLVAHDKDGNTPLALGKIRLREPNQRKYGPWAVEALILDLTNQLEK